MSCFRKSIFPIPYIFYSTADITKFKAKMLYTVNNVHILKTHLIDQDIKNTNPQVYSLKIN